MPETEIHKRKKQKNMAMLAVMLGLVVILFAIGFIRF